MILIVLFGLLMLVAILLYGTMAWGFVLYKFWGWFLIPTMEMVMPELTINPISYWGAVALFIFMIFFRMDSMGKKQKDADWSMLIAAPWAILAVGWLLREILPI